MYGWSPLAVTALLSLVTRLSWYFRSDIPRVAWRSLCRCRLDFDCVNGRVVLEVIPPVDGECAAVARTPSCTMTCSSCSLILHRAPVGQELPQTVHHGSPPQSPPVQLLRTKLIKLLQLRSRASWIDACWTRLFASRQKWRRYCRASGIVSSPHSSFGRGRDHIRAGNSQ